jgi:hypothetical protein
MLEEDKDSSKSNIVRMWKATHKLESYFNCHSSPNLSPIKNCWLPPKQFLKRFPRWDTFKTRELAAKG